MSSELVYTAESLTGGTRPASPPNRLLGGKAAGLVQLRRINQPVPPFYVITTQAVRQAVESAGLAGRISESLSAACQAFPGTLEEAAARIRDWIETAALPEPMTERIREAHRATFPEDCLLAVRSSAAAEDSPTHSFAGMHDSVLYLRGFDQVLAAVKQVWASSYSARALAYRMHLGLPVDEFAMAVIVQEMIDAERSGVMFTCHPTTANPHQIVINAVEGAADGLLNGSVPSDAYTVDKDTLEIVSRLADKPVQMAAGGTDAGGLAQIEVVQQQRRRGSLTDDQIRLAARAGLAIESHFRRPQDVEFCFDSGGRLLVLQSRPVTRIQELGPAAGNQLLWDNSNIIESYSGVTSPMTFSFIRRVYAIVYDCFARVMGVSPRVIRANRKTFENKLGLFQGRVYYNLNNWYRALRMFPGFQYNSRFMESMMGVKESLHLADAPPPRGFFRHWFVDFPALLRLLLRSSWNFWRIRAITDRFQKNFQSHYQTWSELDFRSLAPHQLMALYDQMEDSLLWNWKAPIINDFFVMIFFGALKKLCQSWCGDDSGSLQNELICGEGGLESAAPARMLLHMTKVAQDDPALRALILDGQLETLPDEVAANPCFSSFHALMRQYLKLYGFRCANELKLEEFSMRDRPHLVYQVIRNYLLLDEPAALDVETIEAREQRIRREAEQKAFAALSQARGLFPKTVVFRWVLNNARLGVKNRENMRFARTRIFGLFREMLRALGDQLAGELILDDAEDIFYLTVDEVWDFVKGTAVTTDLRGLVHVRRREFDRYRNAATKPDNRFYTFGMAYHRNRFRNHRANVTPTTEGTLRGIGCCPGEVTAPVKIVDDPTGGVRLSGEILVAEQTDPGWIPLYPAASGLLIERGSVLSHSAVVAREMGIPTIVGVTGLIDKLSDGQTVRMDGRSGTVEIVTGSKRPVSAASDDFVDQKLAVKESAVPGK